jgi:hypothetical protein
MDLISSHRVLQGIRSLVSTGLFCELLFIFLARSVPRACPVLPLSASLFLHLLLDFAQAHEA